MLVHSLLVVASVIDLAHAGFNTKAWQSQGVDYTFPEQEYADIAAKKNVGITFSGGGDRSYISGIGVMAAFHELGFTNDIKYMAGSSGGSWATAVFSYYQKENVSDLVMLGPVVRPADIDYADLLTMHPDCVRAYTNSSGVAVSGVTFGAWQNTIQSVFFTPSGIARGLPFSYDKDTVADIKLRNPDLRNVNFQLLRGNFGDNNATGIDKRPYPIIQATLIGPESMVPWLPANRNYSLMEWAPLTAGVAYTRDMTFTEINKTYSKIRTVGGFIEPYASNGNFRPTNGLPAAATTGLLTVPGPSTVSCDLALACGASSWVPGTASAASTNPVVQITIGELKYWAASAAKPSQQYEPYATGDGAGVSNTNLISLLQRNVTTILAFVSSSTPMQNSTHWNPAVEPLGQDIMDFTMPAWFGQIPVDLQTIWEVGYDLPNSQVFPAEEWLPLITKLQAAQAAGNGIVVSSMHTTVRNVKYGIEPGQKIKVVWSYVGRVLKWEQQLNAEMQSLVVPETDPYNQANLRAEGPFESFPNYGTAVANIDIAKANLLADLTGWVVIKNQNLYREALGLALIPEDDDGGGDGGDDGEGDDGEGDDGSDEGGGGEEDNASASGSNHEDFSSSAGGIVTITLAVVVFVAVAAGLAYRNVLNTSARGGKQHEEDEMAKKRAISSSDGVGRGSEMSSSSFGTRRTGELLSNMA